MAAEVLVEPAARPAKWNSFLLDFEKPLARIEREIVELEELQLTTGRDMGRDIRALRARLNSMTKRTYASLTPSETVQVARHPSRPLLPHYLESVVRDFCELHGDRTFADDRALVMGFGRIADQKALVIGHNKGRDTKEKIICNFGCAHPEGYRKALRGARMAEKFGLPVVCFIDTQGAYPGIGAEERGIAQAIAVNLLEFSRLKTPIVSVVIGEGGSGGALGIGVADRVAMLEHSFYSVISPEGCAAILWKTGEQAKRAAECLKLTSPELKKLDIIDDIIPEPMGGAHRDHDATLANVEHYLGQTLRDLRRLRTDTLVKRRYDKFRHMGSFFESADAAKPAIKKPKKPATKRSTTQTAGATRRTAATPVKPVAAG